MPLDMSPTPIELRVATRHIPGSGYPEGDPDLGLLPAGLATWQLRRVLMHIEANLHEPIPVAALAALVRLSPRHFARASGAIGRKFFFHHMSIT